MSDALRVRRSRAGEEEALGHSAHVAFRLSPTHDSWIRYFNEHGHRSPDDTWVAEVGGELAGHATALRLEMSFDGALLPVRGIAAVAVLPDFRRRGVARALMTAMLGDLAAAREPLAALYPFEAPFYQAHGFGTAERFEIVRVAPSALAPSPLRARVRSFDLARDEEGVRAVYDRWRAGRRGPLARSDYWWRQRVFGRTPDGAVYRDERGRIEGYLAYEVDATSHYPQQTLLVRELVAATPDAARALDGFLEALGEQFAVIELWGARDELAPRLTRFGTGDGRRSVDVATVAGLIGAGAMVRILRLKEALALHPGVRRLTGRVGLDLTDPTLPALAGRWDVELTRGDVRVRKGRAVAERLALSIDQLSACYFGGLSASALLAAGRVTGSPRAAALLDRAFAGPPLFLGRANYF